MSPGGPPFCGIIRHNARRHCFAVFSLMTALLTQHIVPPSRPPRGALHYNEEPGVVAAKRVAAHWRLSMPPNYNVVILLHNTLLVPCGGNAPT